MPELLKVNSVLTILLGFVYISALATLKIGLDIMLNGEGVKLEKMLGHGGFFKNS